MTLPDDTPSEGAARVSATTAGAPPATTAGEQSSEAAADTPSPPAWAHWVTTTGSSLYAWLMRPRVRLAVTGALLLLVGLIATNTVWTLPLVIVGALMVAVAWVGRRLEGRFALEWGEGGTQLAFRATIKPAQPTTDAPALPATSQAGSTPVRRVEISRGSDDVIEGEAHTVEINVGELKALIAAAEAAEEREPAAVRDIRIRRLADDTDRTPRPAG